MTSIRKKAIQGLQMGDVFLVSRRFTRQDMMQFADISKDYNPVHFDKRFAEIKNFPTPICHGLLVGSLITEIGGQIGWLASGADFKFLKPVFFDDTITCQCHITHIDEKNRAKAEASFINEKGEIVIECSIGGVIPGDIEKEVMQAMVDEGDPTNKATE